MTGDGPMGWPDSVSFHQPGLEALLAERATELPGVTVLRPHQVTALAEHDDRVEVTIAGPAGEEVRAARWVVGCDGANSFVREHLGSDVTDLGFTYDWLVCDVVPHETREFKPNNLQVCDPARPRTAVSAGPGHRRWSSCGCRGEPGGVRERRERLAAARPLRHHTRERDPGAVRRLHHPGVLGRPLALRPDPDRR